MGQLRTLKTKCQGWRWGPLERLKASHHIRLFICSVFTEYLLCAQPCGYRDKQSMLTKGF